jgi:hypothetical protein
METIGCNFNPEFLPELSLKEMLALGVFCGPSPPLLPRSTRAILPAQGAKGAGNDAQPSCRSPGFSEPRVFADQFQRNGVILDQRFRCLEWPTPVLSVGEERGGFTGIFEIVAADKAGVVGWKRRPICAGNVDCRPYHPFATLGSPIYPRHPYLPKGAKGPGNDAQSVCRPTDDPTAQ